MKRKNAFTLIELLAVIVILAVIALIAVPLVMNTIESSKRGAFKESVRGLLEASYLASAKNNFEGINYEIKDGVVTPNLEYKGNTKHYNGRFYTVNDESSYAMVSDGKYCAYQLGKTQELMIVEGNIETCKDTLLALDETGAGLVCPTCVVAIGEANPNDVKEGVTFWNTNSNQEEVGTLKEKTYEELQEAKRFYLYKDGEEYIDITGGWTSSEYGGFYTTSDQGYTLKSVTKNSDHLLLSTTSPATRVVVGTVNKVDISGYRKIGFEVDPTSISTYSTNSIGFTTDKYMSTSFFRQSIGSGVMKNIIVTDLPTFSETTAYIYGTQYYSYGTTSSSYKIYKIWLEK